MVKVKRNDDGGIELSLGDIIKIIVAIGAVLTFYFTGFREVSNLLERHDVRIEHNEKRIEVHGEKIDKLFETKADKK